MRVVEMATKPVLVSNVYRGTVHYVGQNRSTCLLRYQTGLQSHTVTCGLVGRPFDHRPGPPPSPRRSLEVCRVWVLPDRPRNSLGDRLPTLRLSRSCGKPAVVASVRRAVSP